MNLPLLNDFTLGIEGFFPDVLMRRDFICIMKFFYRKALNINDDGINFNALKATTVD